jgi:hypothetical protein
MSRVTFGLTILNLIFLIIAIATHSASIGWGLWITAAPASLIAAIVVVVLLGIFQLIAHKVNLDPKRQSAFHPITYHKSVVRDLLVASANLNCLNLAFATASLCFLAPIQEITTNAIYNAAAAFTIIYFFAALVAAIVSIIALCPMETPTHAAHPVVWGFALFSSMCALLAWILQAYSAGTGIPYQVLMTLLGWIISIAAATIAIAAHYTLEDNNMRYCCSKESPELRREREIAEIERAKFDAYQYRRRREDLEHVTQV